MRLFGKMKSCFEILAGHLFWFDFLKSALKRLEVLQHAFSCFWVRFGCPQLQYFSRHSVRSRLLQKSQFLNFGNFRVVKLRQILFV